MNARADLHVHTTASDGQCAPEQVVEMARALGLRAIAITDHETTLGVRPAQEAAAGTGMDVVPGVEISTDSAMGELHVLGYFIEPDGNGLEGRLRTLREGRLRRARRMVEKLAAMGLPLPWTRVRDLAEGESVGRPHVARAMLEMGYVASTDEAFARYIGTHGPAYVSRTRVATVEAILMIRQARGVPVLAHPLQATGIVPDLVKAGLQGIEAHYPGYSREEVRYLEGIAHRYRLIATGGSDFHGPDVLPVELGAATVPFEVVDQLRSRRPEAAEAQ
jgi:predicted metal-dependent phosphoesterase TrpH